MSRLRFGQISVQNPIPRLEPTTDFYMWRESVKRTRVCGEIKDRFVPSAYEVHDAAHDYGPPKMLTLREFHSTDVLTEPG